ncbi:MAG: [Fe-Fe] hydrogenase large subunit C-terminal domain-containing protein [Ignavibacteria bacterium]
MIANSSEIYNHSIYFESSKCTGEMACLKVCPVEAIRVRNGKAMMIDELCIDCSVCVKVCKTGAIVPLTNSFNDFSKFEYTIAVPSLALYSQFDRRIKPKEILTALKRIGFDEVADSSRACLTVYKAVEKYIKNYTGRKPLIATFCPTCIKLIQIRYPELLGNLIPIISPMELAAKEIKIEASKRIGVKKEDIGVIYITPCPSKMTSITQKGKYYSDFDGAIPISDIYNTLYGYLSHLAKKLNDTSDYYDISGMGLNIGRMGGLASLLGGDNCIGVSGINDVLYMLEDIERGKLHDIELVEMHACLEGCIGGSMVVENVYYSRNKMLQLIEYFGEKKLPVGKKDIYKDSELFYNNIYEPLPLKPIDEDLNRAIGKITERKEILSKLPNIDCGACGSPTCSAFADDVVKGDCHMNNCIFILNEELKLKLKQKIKSLLETQKQL